MNWFVYCLKHYAQFTGRASRAEYWQFALVLFAGFIVLAIIDALMGAFVSTIGFGLLSGLWALGLAIPGLAAGARRLHDTGRSGWWQLLNIIPYVGWIPLVVLLALKGGESDNKWGPAPTHDASAP